MKDYDILIAYEIKNREIENVSLLKRELENRGYSVGICMQYSTFFKTPKPLKADVMVVPAYYRERAMFYSSSHLVETKKIVNLRWEQVFNNFDDNNSDILAAIKPWGYDVVHLAWGERPYERLINEWHVPEQNVKLTGQISLDFLRGNLRNYYLDRTSLMAKYNIPKEKRVNLFISSLSLATMHAKVLDFSGADLSEQVEIEKKTQSVILEWFERILSENDNDVIVYRPHPEEKSSELLKALEKNQPGFYVIGEESIKQWVLASDRIYNWASTSIAEVYAAGKGCTMLRPVELPFDNEMSVFNNAKFVTTFEEFKKAFNEDKQSFDVDIEQIKKYYYIDDKKYSFELVADVIEEVYKSDKYPLKKPMQNAFKGGLFNIEYDKNLIKRFVAKSRVFNSIYEKKMFPNSKLKYYLDDIMYTKRKLEENYVSEEEINEIIKKIDLALNNGEKEE